MRYYHYISNAKVDMLFPQIPAEFLSGLKVELGFNFGLLQGKVVGEQRDPTTDVARVQALEKFFEKEGLIQTDLEEGTWFRGSFIARSGFLPTCPGLILFGGRLNDGVLLLAGSEAHLISGSANPGKDRGWSFMPRTLDSLKTYLKMNFDLSSPGITAESMVFGGVRRLEGGGAMFSAFSSIPEDSLPEPETEFSFLARIFLVRTNNQDKRLALGSPLYVAE